MNREFLLNAAFLVFVNLLIKPFYVFGIERNIQETVGPEAYGLYATLFSFTFLLFMVNDFGIHYFNNRTIARHPHLVGKYLPNILGLKVVLSLFYIAVVLVAAALRGFEPEIFHLVFFIALNHIFISLTAYLRSNISGLGMYRTDSLVSTLDKLVLIALCAVLLWGGLFEGAFQIEWFVHAQNIAWGLTALAAFLVLKNKVRQPFIPRFNWPFWLAILKKSAPFALAVFLMTAYTRLDMVVLEWMLPDGRHEAGVYAAAYRLLDAFNIVGFLFAGLLLPMFSALLRRQEVDPSNLENLTDQRHDGDVKSLLRFSLQLIWAGAITLAVPCFFFREDIMFWLYPVNATAYYGEVLGFLILTLVPFSGVFIYSTLLTANNSLKKMNRLFIVGIVLNVTLNLLLIPPFKAVGAGLSALCTQSLVMFGQMWIVKKELRFTTEIKPVLKILGFIFLVVAVNWQLYMIPKGDWLLRFGLGITAGLLSAFLFRLVRWKLLFDMAKRQT